MEGESKLIMEQMEMCYFINMACLVFPEITVNIHLEADATKWDDVKLQLFPDNKCVADV